MIYNIYKNGERDKMLYRPVAVCYYEAAEDFSMQARMKVQREMLDIRKHNMRWHYDMLKWKMKQIIEIK